MSTQKHRRRPRHQQHQLPEDFLCDFLLKKNRFHVVDKKWKPTATAINRFLQNCRGLTPEMTSCVIWMGSQAHLKYASSPRFYLNGRHVSIQNMVYVWFVGSLETGSSKPIGSASSQWITTTCQKRLCVNPLHLKFRRDLKVSASIRKKRKKRRRRSRKKKQSLKKKIQ